MLRLHYRGGNGNGHDSELIKKIYGLRTGGEIIIGPDDTDYKTFCNMLLPVTSNNEPCCQGNGCSTHYSVPVHANGNGSYLSGLEQPEDILKSVGIHEQTGSCTLEVCLEKDGTIRAKMKGSLEEYSDSFDSFLAANH